MKLIINKFPPITQRCEIDLSKKLTLFVGQNNSGKTYLSQLIWGIYDEIDIDELLNLFNYDITIVDDDLIAKGKFEINIDEKLLNEISQYFTGYIVKYKIKKIFKKDIDCNIIFKIEEKDFKLLSIKSFKIDNNSTISKRKNSNKIKCDIDLKESDYSYAVINNIIFFKILIESLQQSLFLPSSRLFLPSFYKYIFNTEKDFKDSMFKNFDNINETNKKFYAPSYTQPVDNLIKKLIFSLDKPLKENIYLDKLAEIIEGNISVDRAEEIGMADISYNHKSGENIPMYLSSSMVNQLSTLYLYFKYWYQKNNSFLIMDEPEMNLHPSKKIEVMELLMSFASENKLLMATHSNTIAKSLINYMHLFDLKDKKDNDEMKSFMEENDLKMDLDINLSNNDIGIYYFNGKTITEYTKDNDSNIHVGTFTEVEDLQKEQLEYIMDELESYE